MSKGKVHKRYEFGTKVSITTTRDSKTIIGAMAFASNKFDGHTLPEVLLETKRMIGHVPEVALCDRGYKGKSKINEARIIRPSTATKDSGSQHKELMRQRFRKRVGIEPVIGHLKSDHRLNKSYFKGFTGDQINVLMAAAAFNFKKWKGPCCRFKLFQDRLTALLTIFFWFIVEKNCIKLKKKPLNPFPLAR